MCGRLLNFDVDKWVHANCALWTNEVKEHSDGALKNFLQAYKKAQ
jgi:histone-lysine N-methyltransferase MLL3